MSNSCVLSARAESWPIQGGFTISRGAKTQADVVVATARRNGHGGVGECVPYQRYGETIDSVLSQIRSVAPALARGAGRGELAGLLPPGAARNAVDCALWDLAAREQKTSVAALAGLPAFVPCPTAFTLSLADADAMGAAAAKAAAMPILKLKLGGGDPALDIDRVAAIRAARPDAILIADANEGWRAGDLPAILARLTGFRIALIEQPLPAGQDHGLAGLDSPIPLCADESCHTLADLEGLRGRYQAVNIKLDKAGGFTEALAMTRAARRMGFQIMIGCMVSTSLAMAPAALLTPWADFIDLDGPLLLARDRAHGILYENGYMTAIPAQLWGG